MARMPLPGPWIHSRRWDLTWMIGTALIVPLGVLLVRAGLPADAVNLGVTALVGGPHLFATFLTTYADPKFRRAHGRALVVITILVPALVIWLAATRFQILLSLFIFWASLHVLQQNAYLTDVYRRKDARREAPLSRGIDIGLLFVSMYPIAAYKLVHDDFRLGEVKILIPDFVKFEATPWIIAGTFAALALAWIVKSVREQRAGILNKPKTLLIAVTCTIAFLVPAAAGGRRLEVAFQAVNAWHSVQYLAMVWLLLKLRKDRGLQESPFVAALSGSGRATWKFYGLLFLFTAALLGGIAALAAWKPVNLSTDQYYYMSVLSALLIHYTLDSWLFFAAARPGARPEELALAEPLAG